MKNSYLIHMEKEPSYMMLKETLEKKLMFCMKILEVLNIEALNNFEGDENMCVSNVMKP